MKKEIVYSGGGISLLTRRQAGEAIVGALEGSWKAAAIRWANIMNPGVILQKLWRDAFESI